MFSLPATLPPPAGDALASFRSNTTTDPYPRHQVITTTDSSRERGDWGLKRPLPLKQTTKATYALIRVKQIDSIEHITDYSSASDHALTLSKFQELNLPVTLPVTRDSTRMNLPLKSVFEEDRDFTAVDPANLAAIDNRWKFSGPWLAGMTKGGFLKWVEKSVRPKRPAFRAFLKKQIAADLQASRVEAAIENGEVALDPIDLAAITDEQLIEYLRKLRDHREVLFRMVGEFLDLPPLGKAPLSEDSFGAGRAASNSSKNDNPYADRGPPSTHPSAGISYLRTASYLDNHPLYGPQKTHPPVQARIVKPRRNGLGMEAKIGVAGFITDPPGGDMFSNSRHSSVYTSLDPNLKGGSKTYVHPHQAVVNSSGCIELSVADADAEARLVAEELLGVEEAKIFGHVRERPKLPESRSDADSIRSRYNSNQPVFSDADAFGVSGFGVGQARELSTSKNQSWRDTSRHPGTNRTR